MNNLDITKLLGLLSKMDKKDLEKGIKQANSFLKTNNTSNIINNLKKEPNNKNKNEEDN